VTVTVRLPYPPSANKLWRAVQGRNIKSADYRAWLAECAMLLMVARAPKTTGPYHLRLYATRPDRRRRDIDNLLKPCSDALKASGLVADDSDAESVYAAWRPLGGVPGVIAEIEAVKADQAAAA
jgi:crossover junction endodeoxyribonuclease RusA